MFEEEYGKYEKKINKLFALLFYYYYMDYNIIYLCGRVYNVQEKA